MADDESEPDLFVSAREPPPRALTQVSPMVRRLVAPNASPFTFNGTCTYILGRRSGRDHRSGPRRRLASRGAARRGRGRAGRDHSRHPYPSRSQRRRRGTLREATGARVVGAAPFTPRGDGSAGLDSAHDRDYSPDAILGDGERWQGAGYTIEAIATPGPLLQSSVLRASGGKRPVFRRSRDGLVDLDRRAARRFDARLHGLARQAARAPRDDLLARSRRPRRSNRNGTCAR